VSWCPASTAANLATTCQPASSVTMPVRSRCPARSSRKRRGSSNPGSARRPKSQFLQLITRGELEVIDLTIADCQRCITLIGTYADMGLGLVDASVVALPPSPLTTSETSGLSNRSMLTRLPSSPDPSTAAVNVPSSFEVSHASASVANSEPPGRGRSSLCTRPHALAAQSMRTQTTVNQTRGEP